MTFDDPHWPTAGDETSRKIRDHDWTSTALGPTEAWPSRLKAQVELVTEALQPMYVAASADLLIIYNTAFSQFLADKHPAAFGRPMREVFAENWSELEHMLAQVMAGQPRVLENVRFSMPWREAQPEGWFTLSLVPLRDDHGGITGLIASTMETTETVRVHAKLREREERQRFLLKLSDTLRQLEAPAATMNATTRLLCQYLRADRAAFFEMAGEDVIVEDGFAAGPSAGRYPADLFGRARPDGLLPAKTAFVVADVAAAHTRAEREVFAALEIGAYIAVPLCTNGAFKAGLAVHSQAPRAWTAEETALVEEVAERVRAALERARAEAALRESEEWLRNAVEVGRLGIWDWDLRTGEVTWSDEHFRMQGYAVGEVQPSYQAWADRLHPDDRAETESAMQAAMQSGAGYEHEFRVVHPDGAVHWLHARGRFFYDAAGNPVRMVGAMGDMTKRREMEEHQRALIAELQHRTMNLIGVVHALADKTARGTTGIAEFSTRFNERLLALARVQRLLSRLEGPGRVAFDELLEAEFSTLNLRSDRVTLTGPSGILLRSSTVQTLAMALHELATNAVRHGALGQPAGRLRVAWRFEAPSGAGEPWLHIDWRETGGALRPDTPAPGGPDEGRELIEQALPYQLNAETSYRRGPEGVECTISIPVSQRTVHEAVHQPT